MIGSKNLTISEKLISFERQREKANPKVKADLSIKILKIENKITIKSRRYIRKIIEYCHNRI